MSVGMSSTLLSAYNGDKLLDDDVASTAITLNGTDEWMRLDLGDDLDLTSIEITNRNVAGERLDGAVVSLLDTNGATLVTFDPIAGAENGEVFTAKIAAKQDENPLPGMKVKWEIDGGILQLSDKKTSTTGEAVASIMSTSDKKVNVQASVSGTYYSPTEITNTVRVNATSEFVAFAEEPEFTKPEIAGVDPVIIIVPTMIILMGFMLMKKGVIKIKNTPSAPEPVPIQEV